MWKNFKLFEENDCGNVFSVLNDYLENLIDIHDNLKQEIKKQRVIISDLNVKLNNGEEIPIDILDLNNKKSETILKDYNNVKSKILETNTIMKNFILDNKKTSKKFFKQVLSYNIEKENYENCETLQKIIKLLS